MRFPTTGDLSDAAHRIRNKVVSVTHNNEKHVDDFDSGYSTEHVESKGEASSTPANAARKTMLPFGGSSSKQDPAANVLGADPIVKTFYESSKSRPEDNRYDWCEYPPRQISKKQALRQDRVAIKLYKVNDTGKAVINGRHSLKDHMLQIQNPTLITALRPILKKQEIYLDPSEVAEFYEPFRPLYFSMDEIAELQKTTQEPALRAQLTLLMHVMGGIFGNVKATVKAMQEAGLISYKNAWIYFPRDCMIYVPGKDAERIFKVTNTRYDTKPFPRMAITAREIQFDGKAFAWMPVTFELASWTGSKPISSMKVYPLRFHPEAEAVRKRIQERGRKVLDYQGLSYCKYTGVAFLEGEKHIEKHNVDGRILIDVYGYSKHHIALDRQGGKEVDPNNSRIEIVVVRNSVTGDDVELDEDEVDAFGLDEAIEYATTRAREKKRQEAQEKKQTASSYIKRLSAEDQQCNKDAMLAREEDLVYVSPMLRGYALQNKLWLQFYVDDVAPVVWNDEAYDHLVYPEEQKDLVLSFVETHQRTRLSELEMDDVIKGKGQGLVFLLSGPPGTGKTLTAEAVADRTRRPLYYLQAEDLGINPALLGANLKNVFEMSTEWDAVILLDEADVFMAERNPQDIARNELVSIFLRELEYFRGIIFLTTNLYSTIDSAFRSRVNIHLLFNSLAPEHRLILWRKFLERLPPMKAQPAAIADADAGSVPVSTPGQQTASGTLDTLTPKQQRLAKKPLTALDFLNEEDLKELAQWDLNGREIKNAIKTVKTWCDAKAYEMNLSRLESGIRVTAPNSTKRGAVDDSLYD